MAFNHGEPAKAIQLLEAAAPYELGEFGDFSVGFSGSLYPIYVRGVAYLAAHKGEEAVREYPEDSGSPGHYHQSIRSAHWRTCSWAGRSRYQEIGIRRRLPYQDFLTLWKDADPDIPISRQAKAEYTKLQ